MTSPSLAGQTIFVGKSMSGLICHICRNVGDTNQIAECSIITKLLRVRHIHDCVSFSNEILSLAKVAS